MGHPDEVAGVVTETGGGFGAHIVRAGSVSGGASGQGGYYYQNLVAVDHLLDLVEFGNPTIAVTLEAAASAQYVDDVVVEQPGLTQFIQVKWAEDERASITLAGLAAAEVSASGSGPSLFRKLALGFNQASSLAGGDVRIILRSTWRPGTQRRPSDGWDRSLAEFIRYFHGPFVACDDWQLTSDHPAFGEYSAVLEKLQHAAGLDGDDAGFTHFLKRLTFDLDQPPRDACRDRLTGRLTKLGIDPARMPTLLDAVVRWSIDRRRVQAEDVLRELGLESSFSEAIVQYFPVDEEGWVDRPEVFSALDDAIEGIDGGYVLVEGEPGIGKSTAVAHYLIERGDVSFGYYCFVPDEQSLGNERLTEAAFLRSLCAGIRSAFPDVSLPHPYADPSLRLVNEWLEALAGSDEKVVIIVDGLDHVARKVQEGTLSAPLTRVLDGMPPNGVTFVLTSRSDGALPPSLQQLLALEPHRRIAIPPLTPAQVEEFLDRRGASVSAEELDIALKLSAGLPVYLEVIARTIADVHGHEREAALNNSIRLGDEGIERFHGALWTEVQPQPLKRRLLALLARRTEVTAVSTLHSLVRHLGS